MTTTTERGPMEQWLDDHNYDKVYLGSDENLYDFAREQDARLAACVAALEAQRIIIHETGHPRHITLEECGLPNCVNARTALRRARGETP